MFYLLLEKQAGELNRTKRQIRQEAREGEKEYIKHTVCKTVNSTKPTNRGLQTVTNASLCAKANNATTNARNKTRYKKQELEKEKGKERDQKDRTGTY